MTRFLVRRNDLRSTSITSPGHSHQDGGLFFTRDPRSNSFALRALGFSRP